MLSAGIQIYLFLMYFRSVLKKKASAPHGRLRNDAKLCETLNSLSDPDYVPPVKRGHGRPRKHYPAPETPR